MTGSLVLILPLLFPSGLKNIKKINIFESQWQYPGTNDYTYRAAMAGFAHAGEIYLPV